MKSLLGQKLNGRYEIVRQLQQKSSHITYLAEDRQNLGYGQCLVKHFTLATPNERKNWHPSDRFKNFLVREIQRVRQFNEHPQIPPVLDYFVLGKELCLIRKFIVGTTLEAEIAHRQLAESEVLSFLQAICTSLAVIHQAGEKHLNLKPTNIIFAIASQKIFITDFDHLESLLGNTIVKSVVREATSTPNDYYIAPEQKLDLPQFSSDFYALGAIAIKALTGKSPHQIRFERLDNYARASLVDITTRETTQISSQLAKVLANLVQKNPQSRLQSAEAILQSLTQSDNVVVLPSLDTVYSHFENRKPQKERAKSNSIVQKKSFGTGIKLALFATLAILGAIVASISIKNNKGEQYLSLKRRGLRSLRQTQFTEYRNENYGIALKYPQDWTVEELEDPITGDIAVLIAPLENTSDSFQEKIYLSIDNYVTSQEEYSQYLLDKIQDTSNTIDVSDRSDSVSLGDRKAQSIIYQRKQENIELQQKETFAFQNDRVYSLTYVAEKSKYQKFLNTANEVIKSFSIEGM